MSFVVGMVTALFVIFLLAYVTIKKPLFGKVMIFLTIIMIMTSSYFYFQKDQRVENKKHLIPIEQIELTDIQHSLAYGNYYKLTANLKNNSPKYRLQSIILKLAFFNCPASKSFDDKECHLVLEKTHRIKTRMPAGQSRAIESYFLLDDEAVLNIINDQKKDSIRWKVELLNGLAR